MVLEIIGMHGGITGGTEDAISSIFIPQDGLIRAVDWDARTVPDADNEITDIELSFLATNQVAVNDTRGRISSISVGLVVLTAVGINSVVIQKFVGPFELQVSGGERIYIHSVSTAGVAGLVRCNIHFDGGATVTRRSARR